MEPSLKMMKAKMHRATVTQSDLHYEGSIGIDANLLATSGILPNESVHVWNVNTGDRWQTYAIPMPAGSADIQVNGAAARLAQVGDLIIIAAFTWMPESLAIAHTPRMILVNAGRAPGVRIRIMTPLLKSDSLKHTLIETTLISAGDLERSRRKGGTRSPIFTSRHLARAGSGTERAKNYARPFRNFPPYRKAYELSPALGQT
jgi:aspartate 1-decarboxylase